MKRIKVWDLAVRLTHALYGLLVLGAFLTAEDDGATPLHTRLGLALLGVVLFRVVWGFVGGRHARFADFVRSPRQVLAYARQYVRGRPGHHVGHNPLGGAMVVALLVTLVTVALTGIVIALGPEWAGPLSAVLTKRGAHAVKEVHEAAAWLLPVLVGFHVMGVVLSSLLEKQNLVAGMVTGFKRAPEAEAPGTAVAPAFNRAVGLVAAAVLSVGCVLALWRLMPVGEAEAAAPRPALLDAYAQDARAAEPAFAGFDAARGRALYFEERDGKTGKVSCVTCHTRDARAVGRSPVGKVIDPLAPSANPQRFAERAQADKWFDRNCKQVLGRTCTARERGDFLAYLLTL